MESNLIFNTKMMISMRIYKSRHDKDITHIRRDEFLLLLLLNASNGKENALISIPFQLIRFATHFIFAYVICKHFLSPKNEFESMNEYKTEKNRIGNNIKRINISFSRLVTKFFSVVVVALLFLVNFNFSLLFFLSFLFVFWF